MPKIPVNPEVEEVKAERLKMLRQMAGLTAMQLAKKYDFSLDTLKHWEAASRKGSISPKGAHKMAQAMRQEGIEVSPEWILYGQGGRPRYISDQAKLQIDTVATYEEQRNNEANEFCAKYDNAVIITINDDAMLPLYETGDIVGGIWVERNQFSHLHQRTCVIEYPTQGLICRQLIRVSEDHYNCVVTNPNVAVTPLIIEDAKIKRAAPILRVWKTWK